MRLRQRIPRRPDLAALEPEDPAVACECTRCRQDVYQDELTFEDGLGNRLCEECFRELIADRLRHGAALLATELGYEVVRHV